MWLAITLHYYLVYIICSFQHTTTDGATPTLQFIYTLFVLLHIIITFGAECQARMRAVMLPCGRVRAKFLLTIHI